MLKKSVKMQLSYMLRSKATAFILILLLVAVGANWAMNLKENWNTVYISQMFSFDKKLTLSDWSMVGYFMMQYYPLLIVIPTAWVYVADRNSGISTYIQSRVGKRSYLYGKLISVFLLTSFIFIIPFLMEILLSVICFSVESNGDPSHMAYWETVGQEGKNFLSNILLHSKILYSVLMTLIFGVVSAILATFNFAITILPAFKMKIVTFFPLYILLFAISFLPKVVELKYTVDYHFILRMFENGNGKNYLVYFMFLLILMVISFTIVEWKIKKEEIL